MWWILAAIVALAILYRVLILPHKYWTQKGVKQGNPKFIVGDNWGTIFRKQSFAEMVQMVYNTCPNTRYSGSYQFLTPTLVLKDPELIKQITVKDFDHFLDHRTVFPEDVDPLWSNNLGLLTGKKWRDMRSNLSPAFTSSKMKYMFALMLQTGEQFVDYFLKQKEKTITVEMKDTLSRFSNDVIANTAFGVECNSLEDRSNEFYLMAKEAGDFSGPWRRFRIFGYFLMPKILTFFKIPIFSHRVSAFFNNLIKSNIQSRQKHKIVRPDLVNILLEARKNGFKSEETLVDTGFATVEESSFKNQMKKKMSIKDEDITSQALIFVFAGFDAVSSLMSFMSYELAINTDIQEKLMQEVDETFETCQGQLTYEAVVGMKYMDMVVSETLRKWPVTSVSDRICTKPYTIEPKLPGEKILHLEKGQVVWLPIFGLHRDPQHYPDPERFDPERFNAENRKFINPYTYLPFGSGPRNCIGSRFALLEAKILFFCILTHFRIVPTEQTQTPIVISKKHFGLHSEGGFWLGLKRRILLN